MKTKLLAAALAGLLASALPILADSYNITLKPGYNLIALNLDKGGGFMALDLVGLADGSFLSTWDAAMQDFSPLAYTYFDPPGIWDPALPPWNPGQATFLYNSGASVTVTVNGPSLVTPGPVTLPSGLSLLGSQFSGPGTFETIFGSPAAPTMQLELYRYTVTGAASPSPLLGDGFELYTYSAGTWTPSAPVLSPGEGVFIKNLGAPVTGGGSSFPLAAVAVWPSQTPKCSGTPLTIIGRGFTGFTSGDTLELTGGGLASTIPGTAITVLNDDQVRAMFDLTTASPGAVLNVVLTKGGVTKTMTGGFQVMPLAVSAAAPSTAGNCGSAAVTIVGTGFCPDSTVELQGTGGPIPGTVTSVNATGTALTATFNLLGATMGSWDVVVTTGTWSSPPASVFSVVACVPPQIDVQIVGPPKIGANRTQWFQVLYRNIGNNDNSATGVTIDLTGVPASVNLADITGPGSHTLISGGFSFTVPVVPATLGYSSFSFSLIDTTFPFTFSLTATSQAPYPDVATISVDAVASYDPNDKFGLPGVGAGHYIAGSEVLPYTIHFENKPSATAPAQEVFVTDSLDITKLEVSTFSLGPITFGYQTITPPPGLKHFTTDVLFDVDGNSATGADDIIVRIVAHLETDPLDPNYGRFTCNYRSLDPLTGTLPVDPLRGFLPPNVIQPKGEGSVQFTIMPKPGLPDGTILANGATIVFDLNAPIITPVWQNIIDQAAPDSAVAPLPAVSTASPFTVTWSGTDTGSGIASYDIYVSDNGAPATLWLGATTATADQYTGANGHTYTFYSMARDALGNVEAAPVTPDATTTVNTTSLKMERDGAEVRVTWSGGMLQASSNLPGNWTDVIGQTSPWTFTPTAPMRFFRVRAQ